MRKNPVGWFEIYVNDMPRAKKFYQTVMQTEFTQIQSGAELEMWQFPSDMTSPGTSGTLCKMEGFSAGRNSVIVYFMSDDCAKEESRIVAAGGKIHKSKFSIGQYGNICLAYDTEGNIFGVHSMK